MSNTTNTTAATAADLRGQFWALVKRLREVEDRTGRSLVRLGESHQDALDAGHDRASAGYWAARIDGTAGAAEARAYPRDGEHIDLDVDEMLRWAYSDQRRADQARKLERMVRVSVEYFEADPDGRAECRQVADHVVTVARKLHEGTDLFPDITPGDLNDLLPKLVNGLALAPALYRISDALDIALRDGGEALQSAAFRAVSDLDKIRLSFYDR